MAQSWEGFVFGAAKNTPVTVKTRVLAYPSQRGAGPQIPKLIRTQWTQLPVHPTGPRQPTPTPTTE
jgi:hypothetical protein